MFFHDRLFINFFNPWRHRTIFKNTCRLNTRNCRLLLEHSLYTKHFYETAAFSIFVLTRHDGSELTFVSLKVISINCVDKVIYSENTCRLKTENCRLFLWKKEYSVEHSGPSVCLFPTQF
jgi:hypothetical protein